MVSDDMTQSAHSRADNVDLGLMPLLTAETAAADHDCSARRRDQGRTTDHGVDKKLCKLCTPASVASEEETAQQCLTAAAAASAGCSDTTCSCKEDSLGVTRAAQSTSRLDAALRTTDRLQALLTILGLLVAMSVMLLSYQGPALLCYLINTAAAAAAAAVKVTDWHPWFSDPQRCWEATAGKALEIEEYFWQDAVVALAVTTSVCVLVQTAFRLALRSKSSNNSSSTGSSSSSNDVGDSCCMCVWLLILVTGCASVSVCYRLTLRQQVLVSAIVSGAFACMSDLFAARPD